MTALNNEQEELLEFVTNRKTMAMIVSLRQNATGLYKKELARKADVTYSHSAKVIDQMVDHNLALTSKDGRKVVVSLTRRGEKIADIVQTLINDVKKVA